MKICPRALTIFAALNWRSDTVEDLARDQNAVPDECSRRVRQRVGLELRPAGNEPERLDEAARLIHPARCREPALGRKELGHPGECGVESLTPRWGWLLGDQLNRAGSR